MANEYFMTPRSRPERVVSKTPLLTLLCCAARLRAGARASAICGENHANFKSSSKRLPDPGCLKKKKKGKM